MNVEDVMRCSFSCWYGTFEDVTIQSIILPIPPEFMAYLHADTIVLPEGAHQGAYSSSRTDDEEDDETTDWDSSDHCKEVTMPDCQHFLNEIEAAITQLGGKVFPKLNWSSPQDASWVSLGNSLECCSASDVCLLLKSSDFISHDLYQPFLQCDDGELGSKDVVVKHELVLRQWRDINTSHEFRCFVKHGNLIGICPRNHSKFFRHIVETKEEIALDIQRFFEDVVDGDYAEDSALYTFDVWRRKRRDVVLVDFNPFGSVTDSLLFSWDELNSWDTSKGCEFRCVEEEAGVQPNTRSAFGVPTDFLDLATGSDPFKLMDLMNLGKSQGQGDVSSDDDGEESTDHITSNTSTDR